VTKASDNLFPGIIIRESADDGSDFSNPAADYRRLFLGEDGLLKVKDSAGAVTSPYSSSGSGDFSAGSLRVPVGTGALATTEGHVGWQSTTERLRLYDGQRERIIGAAGWVPHALMIGAYQGMAISSTTSIAANGGTLLIPYSLAGHMLLEAVAVRQASSSLARQWGWDLYEQRLNNGNGSENTLDRVAACSADDSFTPGAASIRTLTAGSAPVYLAPGVYWLAIQCRHASNAFVISHNTGTSSIINTGQTKTTTNPNGATLDAVAATWTKQNDVFFAALLGRVFGQTTAF
jgi:hypothetical protein